MFAPSRGLEIPRWHPPSRCDARSIIGTVIVLGRPEGRASRHDQTFWFSATYCVARATRLLSDVLRGPAERTLDGPQLGSDQLPRCCRRRCPTLDPSASATPCKNFQTRAWRCLRVSGLLARSQSFAPTDCFGLSSTFSPPSSSGGFTPRRRSEVLLRARRKQCDHRNFDTRLLASMSMSRGHEGQ